MKYLLLQRLAFGLCIATTSFTSLASAQNSPADGTSPTLKKEIDVSFADFKKVKPILVASLSPIGKFVFLPHKGGVIVIDTPSGIRSAESALKEAELPQPQIHLDFQFITGLPQRKQSLTITQEVPLPTSSEPGTIVAGEMGSYSIIPATPTDFETRSFGTTSETSETTATQRSDGSVQIDTTTQTSEFGGFVNYGSTTMAAGSIGAVQVSDGVSDPSFFEPLINRGGINLPISSTTKITTSIVIRPRVDLGTVHLDMMPRLTVRPKGKKHKPQHINLKQYRTELTVQNRTLGRIYGFAKANDEFNREFFQASGPEKSSVAITIEAKVTRPSPAN